MTSDDPLASLRDAAAADPSVPEALRRVLAAGATLTSIELDERGRWFHEGVEITHRRLSTLFHRGLHRTAGGTWLITLAPYSYPVRVARWGRFVVAMNLEGLELAGHGQRPYGAIDAWSTDGHDTVVAHVDGYAARVIGKAWAGLLDGIEEAEEGFALRLPTGERVRLAPLAPAD